MKSTDPLNPQRSPSPPPCSPGVTGCSSQGILLKARKAHLPPASPSAAASLRGKRSPLSWTFSPSATPLNAPPRIMS